MQVWINYEWDELREKVAGLKKKSDQRFILHFVGFSEMLHTFEKEYSLYYVIIK